MKPIIFILMLIITLTLSSTPATSLPIDFNRTGLVLEMYLNNDSNYGENNTHIYDFSGTGNNCTVLGDAVFTTIGKYGGALTFDGVDDYGDCGSIISANQSFTVTFWAYRNDLAYGGLVSEYGASGSRDWFFNSQANSDFVMRVYESDNTYINYDASTGVFPLETWIQLGLIVDYENTKLYSIVNGVRTDRTSTWDGSLRDSGAILTIGRISGYEFNGTIDEFRIHNRVLSATEIETSHNEYTCLNNFPNVDCNYQGKQYGYELYLDNVTYTNQTIHYSDITIIR